MLHGGTGVAWALVGITAMAAVLVLVLAIKRDVYLRVRAKGLDVSFEPVSSALSDQPPLELTEGFVPPAGVREVKRQVS